MNTKEPEETPEILPENGDENSAILIDRSWPSTGTIVRIVIAALVVVFVFNRIETIVTSLTSLLFLIVLSVFVAYLLDPLVQLFRRPFKAYGLERLMPRGAAIVLTFILVFTTVGVTIWTVSPLVIKQGQEFTGTLPEYLTRARAFSNDLSRRFDRLRLPPAVESKLNEEGSRLVDGFAGFIAGFLFGGFLLNLLMYAPWLVLVPILAFFFLKDVNLIRLAVLRLFPPGRWRLRAEMLMHDVNTTLAAYTRAQLISCLLIGIICTIGFSVLGLRYALLLGIIAAILEFIPLLGPLTVAVLVTTTAALGDNPWRALYVAVFLAVLRVVHDYVTYPRIVRGGIHLHPLLIILSVLAGEQVAGIPGVFLAIPIVALVTVIYRHVLEHRGHQRLFDGLSNEETEPEEGVA